MRVLLRNPRKGHGAKARLPSEAPGDRQEKGSADSVGNPRRGDEVLPQPDGLLVQGNAVEDSDPCRGDLVPAASADVDEQPSVSRRARAGGRIEMNRSGCNDAVDEIAGSATYADMLSREVVGKRGTERLASERTRLQVAVFPQPGYDVAWLVNRCDEEGTRLAIAEFSDERTVRPNAIGGLEGKPDGVDYAALVS